LVEIVSHSSKKADKNKSFFLRVKLTFIKNQGLQAARDQASGKQNQDLTRAEHPWYDLSSQNQDLTRAEHP
jgi:hypothetical protein